jgi:hypothetical protein
MERPGARRERLGTEAWYFHGRSDRRDAAEQREGCWSFIDRHPNQRSDRIPSVIQMRAIQWRAFTLLLTVSGQEVCQLL